MQGTSENGIAEHNASLFDHPDIAEWYDNQQLYPAERIILDQFRHAYAGKRLLDLGVGTGRTTKPLLPLVGDYIGIDRSQPMLALARRNFPAATFLDMDVRAIGQFGAERFDCVLGALAILSAFGHEDRLAIIHAISSILAPGGYFIFSFHNRQWKRAGGMPLHRRSWHPREVVNSLHPQSWINYLRLQAATRQTPEYAILVDQAHRWSGLFYFIDLAAQTRQLEAAGFEIVARFGENGRPIEENSDTSNDGLLNLVCRVASPAS
ncbi:class I SAM-dependent methyltransferase [Rhizobium rhizogenes]|uniref:class I SAM-dependent DNA methyltransferase n=1 Tax=Rhizobium rhizogenes TaxID=359 RepID=UPI0022BDEDEF|nr:class I SAM-dependent methyltransferase [Rhizobium rhizogenes]MCZ7463474.1 class I SAM-dependent methyltransferase [Rhizobium rhizogenes]